MKPGDLVWYYPSLNGPGFAAVVDGEIGTVCGTEVVPLRDLGEEYQRYTSRPRSTVSAAATRNLRPRAEGLDFQVIHRARAPELARPAPPKRYFHIDTDGSTPTWCIVAKDAGDAWRVWAKSIADAGEGEDMLAASVRMVELTGYGLETKRVRDDDRGRDAFPLTQAELGAVFCSEY